MRPRSGREIEDEAAASQEGRDAADEARKPAASVIDHRKGALNASGKSAGVARKASSIVETRLPVFAAAAFGRNEKALCRDRGPQRHCEPRKAPDSQSTLDDSRTFGRQKECSRPSPKAVSRAAPEHSLTTVSKDAAPPDRKLTF
jgi:hypothetical protein